MADYHKRMGVLLAAILLTAFALGCSGSMSSVVPEDQNSSGSWNQPRDITVTDAPGRDLLGIYGFDFDEEAVALTPIDMRQLQAHFNVNNIVKPPNCGGEGCLTYDIISWDPITRMLTLDATLENPTQLTGYDVRLIFRNFTKRSLVNADSYTTNFDPEGAINPFIAFGKNNANRAFGPTPTQIIEPVQIYWPAGSAGFLLNIVEACWPGHCFEPYEINKIKTTGPIPPGGSTTIYCDVWDWQANVESVMANTKTITGGWTYFVPMAIGNTWMGVVENSQNVPPGDYPCWIVAYSPDPKGSLYTQLYNKVIITIAKSGWQLKSFMQLPPTDCSLDIGVIGGYGDWVHASNILMASVDPSGISDACAAIDAYTPYYAASALYKSLVNLDPTNNTYQPYPAIRIDATYDGAAGWTNSDIETWYDQPGYTPPGGLPNYWIYSNIDNKTNFNFNWPNDHRHFRLPYEPDTYFFPIDVSDDFNSYQYALFVDPNGTDALPAGFRGAPESNYLNDDIVYYTSLAKFIGPGPGQIEPGYDIGGIDAWQIPSAIPMGICRMFILEHGADWGVEAFDITDTAPGWGFDDVKWVFHTGVAGFWMPKDCELLPTNTEFAPNPDSPTLCVLVVDGTGIGNVNFYDAQDGAYIGNLTTLGSGLPDPPLVNDPQFIDNDDGLFEIHVMQSGPVACVFNWA